MGFSSWEVKGVDELVQEALLCEPRREKGDRAMDTGINFQTETEQPSKRRDSLKCPVQESLRGKLQ